MADFASFLRRDSFHIRRSFCPLIVGLFPRKGVDTKTGQPRVAKRAIKRRGTLRFAKYGGVREGTYFLLRRPVESPQLVSRSPYCTFCQTQWAKRNAQNATRKVKYAIRKKRNAQETIRGNIYTYSIRNKMRNYKNKKQLPFTNYRKQICTEILDLERRPTIDEIKCARQLQFVKDT